MSYRAAEAQLVWNRRRLGWHSQARLLARATRLKVLVEKAYDLACKIRTTYAMAPSFGDLQCHIHSSGL